MSRPASSRNSFTYSMSTGGASLKSINTAPNSRATLRIQPVSNRSPRSYPSFFLLHAPSSPSTADLPRGSNRHETRHPATPQTISHRCADLPPATAHAHDPMISRSSITDLTLTAELSSSVTFAQRAARAGFARTEVTRRRSSFPAFRAMCATRRRRARCYSHYDLPGIRMVRLGMYRALNGPTITGYNHHTLHYHLIQPSSLSRLLDTLTPTSPPRRMQPSPSPPVPTTDVAPLPSPRLRHRSDILPHRAVPSPAL